MSDHEFRPDTDHLTVAEERVPIGPEFFEPPTRARRLLYRFCFAAVHWFTRIVFRVHVTGREHLPVDEAFILAPVHRSNLDFALVTACAPPGSRRWRYLAKDTIWKGAWGRLFTALGAIPVHRGTPDRDSLKACFAALEEGEPLVLFPEGTRQSGPEVQELFDGVAYIQARSGVPVIPVGIGGSEAAMPRGAKFFRPHKVFLVLGEPIPPPDKSDKGRVRRGAVKEATVALHTTLQELFDDAQRRAGASSPGSDR